MPSSVIRNFAYNVVTRELVVTFATGRVYGYAKVPPEIVSAFRNSASKGRFFNQEIRDSYECREVKETAPPHTAPDHKTAWPR